MAVYGEKLENIGTTADNTCKSLNKTGKQISDGTNRLKNDTSSAFDSMESKIAGTSESMRDKLGGLADKLKEVAGAVKDFLRSGYEKVSGIFSGVGSWGSGQSYSAMPRAMNLARSIQTPSLPYAIHPAIAKLSNIEIPKLATGAVLPANREFLAIVGDQKHGTNVEAPLDTIRQASEEAVLNVLSKLGITGGMGSNSQTMVAKLYLDGKQITEAVINDGKMRQMSTGSNPFLLGTT